MHKNLEMKKWFMCWVVVMHLTSKILSIGSSISSSNLLLSFQPLYPVLSNVIYQVTHFDFPKKSEAGCKQSSFVITIIYNKINSSTSLTWSWLVKVFFWSKTSISVLQVVESFHWKYCQLSFWKDNLFNENFAILFRNQTITLSCKVFSNHYEIIPFTNWIIIQSKLTSIFIRLAKGIIKNPWVTPFLVINSKTFAQSFEPFSSSLAFVLGWLFLSILYFVSSIAMVTDSKHLCDSY